MVLHIHIAQSSHGFGHAAQTAPVLAALREAVPGLRVSVTTQMAPGPLAGFLGAVERIEWEIDVGLLMDSPMDVRRDATAAAYRAFHADWDARVDRYADMLRVLRPDLLFANVAALPLAAAQRVGIPAVAMSSLNWAGMYAHYCGDQPDAPRILDQLLAAYRSAPFLLLTPGVPMPELSRLTRIGPVARIGRDRRAEIAQRLGLAADTGLALVSTGGLEARIPYADWSPQPDWHLLVQGEPGRRGDMTNMAALGMPIVDLIRSVDVLVTKTGYGFFAEAACNGRPTVFMRRVDWPEEPHVSDWLLANTAAEPVARTDLEAGRIAPALATVLRRKAPPVPAPSGIRDAVTIITSLLSTR